jgi:glutamate-1-semialdehyde 2,1-aminomutase
MVSQEILKETLSVQTYKEAQRYFPGGVNASARANKAIGRPFYVSRGDGAYVYDLEGKKYIDMCMSHGASLLGHNNPKINEAIMKAINHGVICSYETEYHLDLAKKIIEMIPCADMVRFAGSGTETIMHALRLARTTTGREKIIKFEGHFHGYCDDINFSSTTPLDKAGDPLHPAVYPQSAGIPVSNSNRIIVLPFNDANILEKAFIEHGKDTAALILEPINYDAGCIIPRPGFLNLCRELCDKYEVLLFFDEVLTAFRFAPGGAQGYFKVVPDLAVLGKAFGGGMPISAIVGKREIMSNLRPAGESEHSGTYLAHLTTVLAASAAIEEYSKPDFYSKLEELENHFYSGFNEIIKATGAHLRLQYFGPRFGLFFGIKNKVTDYRMAAKQNHLLAFEFYRACIEHGVYFHVSPHHGFSAVHTKSDIDNTLEVIEAALLEVKQSSSG